MIGILMLEDVLRDSVDSLESRLLVKLISECRTVETVDSKISRISYKRASWETLDELIEVSLGSLVILVLIVAQAPVISYCVITFCTVGQH